MAGRDSGPESGPKNRSEPAADAPATGASDLFSAKDWLGQTTGEMRDNFARNRRVISLPEYLALFGTDPAQQLRSAGQYLRDVFDHFGTEPIRSEEHTSELQSP